jgi:hypothetical protein
MAGGLLGVPPTFGSVADSVLDVVPAAPAGSKPNTFGFGVLQPAKGGSRDFFGSVGSIILTSGASSQSSHALTAIRRRVCHIESWR